MGDVDGVGTAAPARQLEGEAPRAREGLGATAAPPPDARRRVNDATRAAGSAVVAAMGRALCDCR
eukprot:6648623-Pyramimonas_sp.AAC.1